MCVWAAMMLRSGDCDQRPVMLMSTVYMHRSETQIQSTECVRVCAHGIRLRTSDTFTGIHNWTRLCVSLFVCLCVCLSGRKGTQSHRREATLTMPKRHTNIANFDNFLDAIRCYRNRLRAESKQHHSGHCARRFGQDAVWCLLCQRNLPTGLIDTLFVCVSGSTVPFRTHTRTQKCTNSQVKRRSMSN